MSVVIKRGQTYRKYRSGVKREIIGFTTRPDGVKRARLSDGQDETKVRVDQLLKTYQPV